MATQLRDASPATPPRTRPLSLRASLAALVLLTGFGVAMLATSQWLTGRVMRAEATRGVDLPAAPSQATAGPLSAG